ncbi:Eukaryotic translation initiation factor 3 subunit M [Cytospora mali]|uniref:Eukaryotic translation initiation factor 3 subunit M n=1 Tax=Cytospora mali TaxID=578113 RepID=A0A194UY79_CYTMA|nr:Eukaryotic translation initiation factor 3 subunit M [Valsa mali var. pyri (nom. inval.)]
MAPRGLVFVDGSTNDVLQEIADYLQIGDEIRSTLEKGDTEDALTTIVKTSAVLNSKPEKEVGPAYNLLIFAVVNHSKEPKKHLPTICQNLTKPITSSPVNGRDLALGSLSTVFNLLAKDDPIRFNVFLQIVRFVKLNNMFDTIKPALKNVPGWLEAWGVEEEERQKVYVEIADAAEAADENKIAYEHLLHALRTFDADDKDDVASEEAQKLSLRALKMILVIDRPWAYDFQGLRVLAPVQSLADTHPVYAQLLDIFAEQDLEDFNDFNDEHEGFLEKENLDYNILQTKMRLLTFASLAAAHQDREIPYEVIGKGLQVPVEDVELWIIDVIRSQLVEGRMSQRDKVFKVHKTMYRVFGDKQWRELQSRIDVWKTTINHVHTVLRAQQLEAEKQKERAQQELEKKLSNVGMGDGPHPGRGGRRPRNDNDD